MGHALRGGPSRKILEKFAHNIYIYSIYNIIYIYFKICVYIYKRQYASNMWWQLKLYTCSGENERQGQLKDSKILKFWRFFMQGSWPVRIAG